MKQPRKKSWTPAVVTLVLLLGVVIKALDLEGAKEQPCFEIKKTVPVDPNWLLSFGEWYYPLMSRLELYNTALEVASKTPTDLQENDVYYEACLKFEQPTLNDTFEATGFAGKRAAYEFTPSNETEEVLSCHFKTRSGKTGRTFFTLTDNSTFHFAAACWDDNQMTWGVSSPYKTLSIETIALIHEHAESLGFKKEFFTGLQYNYCPE